jgi:phage virion morphogenesis protein
MSIQFRNGISPALARRARAIADRRPILEAMGMELVSITKRNFTDATLRPSVWAPLKPATIKAKKGKGGILRGPNAVLQRSIRVTSVTNDQVVAGTDRPYAAIHQLGGRAGQGGKAVIPARPYFPVLHNQLTPEARRRINRVGQLKIASLTR